MSLDDKLENEKKKDSYTTISESSYKSLFNLKKKLNWNEFNDSIFWSTY